MEGKKKIDFTLRCFLERWVDSRMYRLIYRVSKNNPDIRRNKLATFQEDATNNGTCLLCMHICIRSDNKAIFS